MAGDDGTAAPSQVPTTISPTHIEQTIFKIVEVTDAPSYAPTITRPTYAPTTPAPSFTYTMQAGQCYDKVWLEHMVGVRASEGGGGGGCCVVQ